MPGGLGTVHDIMTFSPRDYYLLLKLKIIIILTWQGVILSCTVPHAKEPHRTDQAMRVGWRIIKDWVHSQLSLVHMNYAEPVEIFLPYIYDMKSNKTVFEQMLEGRLKQMALEYKEIIAIGHD